MCQFLIIAIILLKAQKNIKIEKLSFVCKKNFIYVKISLLSAIMMYSPFLEEGEKWL